MENNNDYTRRISTEEDFMNHNHGSDILYGFMLYLATYDPENQELYLTLNQFKKQSKNIKTLMEITNSRIITRNLDKLEKNGLIQLTKKTIGRFNDVPCYIFPYSPEGKYKIIYNEVLYRVLLTRNQCGVRIYVYLLKNYHWKKDYQFTIKEIKAALGWAETTKTCDDIIKINLESLRDEGIIDYTEIYEPNIYNITVPIKVLKFVAEKVEDIKK